MITTITREVDIKHLILPKDYKPDPKNLELMISSIKEEGLLHPPLIKDNNEVFAGLLRVAASKGAGLGFIFCTIYPSNLTPEEYKIISLHENLKRYNLPWWEQVLKEQELHLLRQEQHGKALPGRGKQGWSLRDTAQELNMAFGMLSEDLSLAKAISDDPNLKKVEDKAHAKKIILERIKRSNQTISSTGPVAIQANTCLLGESGIVLEGFPNNTFDACITDPPWLEYKDDKLVRDAFTLPVFKQVFRVLKNDSFLYAFVSTQDWFFYFTELTKIGFLVQKHPLIWIKEGSLSYGARSWEYQRNYEPLILAVKGSPALMESLCSSTMATKVVHSSKLIHPNEKPKEIIKKILHQCTAEDALVLDPFAGSFVVAETCKDTHRRYVAIEREQNFFLKGQERLK